jgi:arginase family enzyme
MRVVKVKSSQGCLGRNKGCEKAPDEILDELENFYLNERGFREKFEVVECDVVENNIEETNDNIAKIEGDIFIGGDHSITYASFIGFSKKFNNPGLVIFDAHPDCENNFKPPSHEDFLKVLIEDGFLKKENVIIVGVRNWHKKEFYYLKANKIRYFQMKNMKNIEDVCDTVMELSRGFDGFYLSIDIDCVDPAFAPGTSFIEPGGMSSRDLIYFIQRLKLLKNFKRVDIVEVNPDKDISRLTVKLAAKILSELL